MKRISLAGALALSAVALASAGGCTAIVGVGDYAVGTAATDGASDDGTSSEGSSGASSGSSTSSSSSGGSSSGMEAGHDAAPQEASTDGPAQADGGGHLGDPCLRNADCTAQGSTCNGFWCTQPCRTNAICDTNSQGNPNYCVSNATGTSSSCAPGCAANSDCAPFGSSASCGKIDGGVAFACSIGSGTNPDGGSSSGGTIGDPCVSSSDCGRGTCNVGSLITTWCSSACSGTTDTSCGSNTNGQPNSCVSTGNTTTPYICFPGCILNSDCSPYGGTTCQPVSSGSSVSICAGTAGNIGDPCSTSSSSQFSTCKSPAMCPSGGSFCTESCTTDSMCGTTSAGTPNYCGPDSTSSTGNSCYPGCTYYSDCAGTYAGTFCQALSNTRRTLVCAFTAKAIGDPCDTDADCTAPGTCNGYWCTQSCSSPSDTSCGANGSGIPNACVLDSSSSSYKCTPTCTSSSDCNPFIATCVTNPSGSGTVCQ